MTISDFLAGQNQEIIAILYGVSSHFQQDYHYIIKGCSPLNELKRNILIVAMKISLNVNLIINRNTHALALNGVNDLKDRLALNLMASIS